MKKFAIMAIATLMLFAGSAPAGAESFVQQHRVQLLKSSIVSVKAEVEKCQDYTNFSVCATDTLRGTGFFVTQDIIITNSHVIDPLPGSDVVGLSIQMPSKLGSGKLGMRYEVQLIAEDKERDLAMLQLKTKTLKVKPLTIGEEIAVDDTYLSVGFPGGLKYKATSGTVTEQNVDTYGTMPGMILQAYKALVKFSGYFDKGASGSPVLNEANEVVGVLALSGSGYGYAVNVNDLRDFVNKNLPGVEANAK